MTPVNFPEANAIYTSEDPNNIPLPVELIEGKHGQVNICWEVSPEELKKIQETGKVWLSILTFGFPIHPVLVSAEKPENYDD